MNAKLKLILAVFIIVNFFYTEIIAETRPLTRIIVLGEGQRQRKRLPLLLQELNDI